MSQPPARQIRIFLFNSLLALMVVGCAAPKEDEQRPKGVDLYVQGVQQLRAGQTDAAVASLEQAVSQNPELRVAHILLGDAYRNKGNYQKALPHYEAASRLDPYTVSNHYNLGLTYQLMNRLQDAIAAYLRALQLNPKDVKTNMNLGLVYLALGQIDDAVTYLERATRLDPNSAPAWSNLGVALDARGSTVLAESTYRKALELDSSSVVTLQNLAQNLISQEKAAEAVSIMELVVKRTESAAARKRYGDALALGKKFDDAIFQFDLALKSDPKYVPAMNEKGFVIIRKYVDGLQLDDKQRATAVELWKTSLAINPNQPRVVEAMRKWEKPGLFGN